MFDRANSDVTINPISSNNENRSSISEYCMSFLNYKRSPYTCKLYYPWKSLNVIQLNCASLTMMEAAALNDIWLLVNSFNLCLAFSRINTVCVGNNYTVLPLSVLPSVPRYLSSHFFMVCCRSGHYVCVHTKKNNVKHNVYRLQL